MNSKQLPVTVTVLFTLFLFKCPSGNGGGSDKTKLAAAAAAVTGPKPAYVYNSISYSSSVTTGTKGTFPILIGVSFTLTPSVTDLQYGMNVKGFTTKYSISPELPSTVILNTSNGSISGSFSTAPSSKTQTYTVTATFTPDSGYAISGNSTLTKTVSLYVDSAAGISSLTCGYAGTSGGCSVSTAYSCSASVNCSSSATCSNLSDCLFY